MRRKRPYYQTVDRLFSQVVRLKGCCENCGSTSSLQCAHGFSRRYRPTRWLHINAFCLCAKCHVYYTHHPIEWDDWLREQWPDGLYETVREKAMSGERIDRAAQEALAAQFREELRAA